MDKRYKKLMLDQMDNSLKQFKRLGKVNRPPRGWIRAIRLAIGMSGPQLASRLGISPPGVFSMEESEANNRITLKSLNRAAEALDCTVIYALVPNSSLKKMVDVQARKMAEALVQPVSHTMKLEKQLPQPSALARDTETITQELVDNLSSRFWDE
ncbi:MAG: mobile mystery protein A [Candidatus Marinimicrobia bacterium]|nr:mobile mystery protein A [Candidatus Neomarinimicrobiota bacterium]